MYVMGRGENTGKIYPYFTSFQAAQESVLVALLEIKLPQVYDGAKATPHPILPL